MHKGLEKQLEPKDNKKNEKKTELWTIQQRQFINMMIDAEDL